VDGDDDWFSALSNQAMEYATKRASDPKIIAANRKLFQRAYSKKNTREYRFDS
jgi:hypothetical protein